VAAAFLRRDWSVFDRWGFWNVGWRGGMAVLVVMLAAAAASFPKEDCPKHQQQGYQPDCAEDNEMFEGGRTGDFP
jgi:hypothetical protein